MHYEPRTISFLCEVLHPPLPLDPGPIQKIHNQMYEAGAPLYPTFRPGPQGIELSNTIRPGAISAVRFLPDRFQFQEEHSGMTVDDFATRVGEVSAAVADRRHLPRFAAQIVTVRTLVNPKHFHDSRAFLRDAMFGLDDGLAAFERSPQLFGLRLVFPPEPDAPNAHTLRVESFANDPRSLFLENQSSFPLAEIAPGLEALEANVRTTYDFIVERALPFVARFDLRHEE
jgi:hypothetical protein